MKKILIPIFIITLTILSGCNNTSQDIQANIFQKDDCSSPKTIVEQSHTNNDIVVLDVRTPEEYNDGHLSNATNIDFKSENFTEEISKLDKNKSYLVYCRSGNRSSQAKKIMEENSFTKVCNMEGGITKWKEKGGKTCTDQLTC